MIKVEVDLAKQKWKIEGSDGYQLGYILGQILSGKTKKKRGRPRKKGGMNGN